jgi:hypothetical protein
MSVVSLSSQTSRFSGVALRQGSYNYTTWNSDTGFREGKGEGMRALLRNKGNERGKKG